MPPQSPVDNRRPFLHGPRNNPNRDQRSAGCLSQRRKVAKRTGRGPTKSFGMNSFASLRLGERQSFPAPSVEFSTTPPRLPLNRVNVDN